MSAYSFSLDRRGLVTVTAGLATVGALLFCMGVLVGAGARLPAPAARPPAALAAAEPAPARAVSLEAPRAEDEAYEAGEPPHPAEGGVGGPAGEEELFSLQLAEHQREEAALADLDRLGRLGYAPFLATGYDHRWRLRMRVRLGVFGSEDEARLAAAALAERDGIEAVVVPAEEMVP